MKSLTLGLLLLLTIYCAAMPNAVTEISPATCCFTFFTGRIPQLQIISIVKTHSKCREKGFVVSTARGKDICVSQNLDWAKKAFNQQEVNEDSK